MNKRLLITLGPSSFNEDFVRYSDAYGVYLYRINLSHTPLEKVEECIKWVQANTDTPLCLDTEGAQVRNQTMDNPPVFFEEGDELTLHGEAVIGDRTRISFSPNFIVDELRQGDEISIDFDSMRMRVTEKDADGLWKSTVTVGGEVGSNKAVDISRRVSLPCLSEKDVEACKIGLKYGLEHYALSYVHKAEDVAEMRELVKGKHVISKIETRACLENLQDVIDSSDELLIDRGDLSRQTPVETLPFLQRRIISMARSSGVPIHVATNLLETMVTKRMPSRAETNDVISTLDMGCDGLVLAAETAVGKYPKNAVDMIARLVDQYSRWTPQSSILDILQD